jgi:2-hydroxy-6-oxonona-2,4-dienedioate hydrolase
VVLLHGGIPGSSGTAGWGMLVTRLAEAGFRVYCPDQPGFGLSDPRPEYRPAQGVYSHINFLERFVEALCLDLFIAGNSMGCANTSLYVASYPHRVERFILIAGPVGDVMPFPAQDRMQVPIGWDGTRETRMKKMNSIIHHKEAITDDLLEMRSSVSRRFRRLPRRRSNTAARSTVRPDDSA